MLLPHWGHLLSRAACQRFAALRVRNRILDVLRFGTPMAGGYESTYLGKKQSGPWIEIETGIDIRDS